MKKGKLHQVVYQGGAIISAVFVFTALSLVHTAGTSRFRPAGIAQAADETWKQEFNDVCAKTNDSMSLGKEELKALIVRCEKLKPVIEGQEESTRKVYRKRLEMCKNLLVFVLESKK